MANRHHKPILILGANGMLAKSWVRLLATANIPFEAISRDEVDYTDLAQLGNLLRQKYSAVVNCAGYTQVDAAETDPDAAFELNAHFPERLSVLCREHGLKLVHYSTDYVFDGKASQPYSEEHPLAPASVYGTSKALGEHFLARSECDTLLIRTSWLFAAHGQNFVKTILRLLSEKSQLKVVADQFGRPTCVDSLAIASLQLLQAGSSGIFHVASNGICSWYKLACSISELAGTSCKVMPCGTEDFPRPAPRPPYSVLDIGKTEQVIGQMPHWRNDLKTVVSQLLQPTGTENVPNSTTSFDLHTSRLETLS